MPWLVAIEDHSAGARYRLAATCLIGRGPYNHVVLDDTRISRQHAKISPEAGGFVALADEHGRAAPSVWVCGDVTGYLGPASAALAGKRVGEAAA